LQAAASSVTAHAAEPNFLGSPSGRYPSELEILSRGRWEMSRFHSTATPAAEYAAVFYKYVQHQEVFFLQEAKIIDEKIVSMFWRRIDCSKPGDLSTIAEVRNLRYMEYVEPANLRTDDAFKLRDMVCGITRGGKTFYAVSAEPGNYNSLTGWTASDINIIENFSSISVGTYSIQYDSAAAPTRTGVREIDCLNKNSLDDADFQYFQRDVCTRGVKIAKRILAPAPNGPTEKNDVGVGAEPARKSIEQAKDNCKNLGFKTGTTKFGNCVLELTK
jgi:hypothetical protein